MSIIFVYLLLNQMQIIMSQFNDFNADVNTDLEVEETWDFIDVLPITLRRYENCPRCDSISECYAECNKDSMMEFKNIDSWSECQDTCVNLGGKYAFHFKRSDADIDIDADVDLDRDLNGGDANVDISNRGHPDRACAMYRPSGKCICVQGNVRACQNIGQGKHNCRDCDNALDDLGVIDGAPECLSTCQWKYAQEFNEIFGWDECAAQCESLGGDFRFKAVADIDGLNSDPGCAIYARYNNQGNSGKCVCVAGKHDACVGNVGDIDNILSDASPAMLPLPGTETISYEMIEGYGIGVISTLIVLLIGIMIACICRKWKPMSKQYAKVNFVDSEDEQIVIKS